MMEKPRMVIDTDPGHDDAIALILASEVAEVVAVTTVAGNTTIENATNNALRVLDLIGSAAAVYGGSSKPLVGDAEHAADVHGSDGLGGIELAPPKQPASSINAVEFLLELDSADTWIVALGPLTNIAHVIKRDPEWVNRIAGISFMGGSTHGGNITPTAEFNAYFDPEAVDVVLSSGANIRMCGLNLTLQIQVSDDDLRDVSRTAEHASLHRFADANFDRVFKRLQDLTGESSLALHDPCAVLAVTHQDLFTFIPRHVQMELDGRLTRGMTVVDERKRAHPLPNNVDVAYQLEVEAAKQIVLDSLYRK